MSSIPIKMDSIIKHYFDKYRGIGKLPPMIKDKIKGRLPVDMPKTLKHEEDNGIILMGRPDEYFELSEGFIVPFDHKTKSKEPEDVHRSYQLQMDVYSYLLGALDYKTINIAYLAFYYPDECDLHKGMPFHCRILKVKTSPQRVSNLGKKAYDILNSGIPEGKNSCEYCRWTIESSAVEIVEI